MALLLREQEFSSQSVLAAIRADEDWGDLQYHLCCTAILRRLMLMLPLLPAGESYNLRRRRLTRYLVEMGLDESPPASLLDSLLDRMAHVEAVVSNRITKASWADLHFTDQKQMLDAQNRRCCACGVRLTPGAGSDDPTRPELDHRIPFIIGGNQRTNLQLLCKRCNGAKSDDITLATPTSITLNLFYRSSATARIEYWVFERDRSKCTVDGCTNSSANTQLHVRKRNVTGREVFDNLTTFCSDHA